MEMLSRSGTMPSSDGYTRANGALENPASEKALFPEAGDLVVSYQAFNVTCVLADLVRGLKAIQDTAFSSPPFVCFLIAEEDGPLALFAYWGQFSIIYSIEAEIQHTGMITLPMRNVVQLLGQLKKERLLASREHIHMTLDVVTHRRRSRRRSPPTTAAKGKTWQQTFLLLKREGAFLSKQIEAETTVLTDVYDRYRCVQELLKASPTENHTQIRLSTAGLRACYEPVAFAAKLPALYVRWDTDDASLWYGVLLRFEPGDGRYGLADQRVVCLAGDEEHYAVVRRSFYPAVAWQADQPFLDDIHLPSWMLTVLLPLLPLAETLFLTYSAAWIVAQMAQVTLVAARVRGPERVPEAAASPPVAQAVVAAPALLKELKRISKEIAVHGVPWERRIIRLTIEPETRMVRIEPATLGITSPSAEIPVLLECKGDEQQVLIRTKPLETMLAHIRGAVRLSVYEPPELYALVIRQLVQSHFYATQRAAASP